MARLHATSMMSEAHIKVYAWQDCLHCRTRAQVTDNSMWIAEGGGCERARETCRCGAVFAVALRQAEKADQPCRYVHWYKGYGFGNIEAKLTRAPLPEVFRIQDDDGSARIYTHTNFIGDDPDKVRATYTAT